MGLLTYAQTLVAGTPENVNTVQAMLDQVRTTINALDGANIVDGSIASADIADGSVAAADLVTSLQKLVIADGGAGRRLRVFSADQALSAGWSTAVVPFGATFSAVEFAIALPYPLTNGAGVPDWNSNGWTTTYASTNINLNTPQTIRFLGLVLAS